MDKKADSDTPRSEEGHLKRPKTAPKSATTDPSKISPSPTTNCSSESSSTSPSQSPIEACITNARRLLSETHPVDSATTPSTLDMEQQIQALEKAMGQHRDLLDELQRHLADTRSEIARVQHEHKAQVQQRQQAHETHVQRMAELTQVRDEAKADLEETKQAMATMDQIWRSHEEMIQQQEEMRLDLENKKETIGKEAMDRRAQLEETLKNTASGVFAQTSTPYLHGAQSPSRTPTPPPLRHSSPADGDSDTESTHTVTTAISTATTAIATDNTRVPVTRLEELEAERASLMTEYGENLELLKECRKLMDDLERNLGHDAVITLQDKIQQREDRISDLEQQLQTYQTAAEMVEEKTADALLMKMEQIFERRLAQADVELSVVLDAAVAREKALEQKANEAMQRYVDKHQESILAEERGSQVEFELMHQRNRIRELELQLLQLQGLSGHA
ncbi:hypothetical protein BGZ73_002306 [Actinomortierella ambigua]|nr:hypothetical protein BGZ73_002306 [Actinomortierella ambigua]